MNASKENAREAIKRARNLRSPEGKADEKLFIMGFLEAAMRKLPSEASYKRAKKKKKLLGI